MHSVTYPEFAPEPEDLAEYYAWLADGEPTDDGIDFAERLEDEAPEFDPDITF